jgi:hypothetical protein
LLRRQKPEEAKVTVMIMAARRVGSVLISNAIFIPKNWKRGKLHEKLERVCWLSMLLGEEGTRDNAVDKAMAAAFPWFLGEGENLVVRK